MYRGQSSADAIARVVDAVSVPVIASGDALNAARAARLLKDTGAAACFVARGSYGNPWVFGNARRILDGEDSLEVTPEMRLAAFRLHVRLLGATAPTSRVPAAWPAGTYAVSPRPPHGAERAMHCVTLDNYLTLADELEATL